MTAMDREELEEAADPRLELLVSVRDAASFAIEALVENAQLRRDAAYWKAQYDELMASSIRHSEAMVGNVLQLALQKGIK